MEGRRREDAWAPAKTERIDSGMGPHESVWTPTSSIPSGRIACGRAGERGGQRGGEALSVGLGPTAARARRWEAGFVRLQGGAVAVLLDEAGVAAPEEGPQHL